jgi:hypothetical protein
VQAEAVNLFVDTHTYALSRSTVVTFSECVFQYGVNRVTRIFCDHVTFRDCWIGNGTGSNDSVYGNSFFSFYGCVFIPPGSVSVGRSFIYLTNDNGDGGTINDNHRGVLVSGSRVSNEGGAGPLVVCDYPLVNDHLDISPVISICDCTVNSRKPSPYDSGNSENGVIYLKQFPASINFSGISWVRLGGTLSALVAKNDGLDATTAPRAFGINVDDMTYRTAGNAVGETSSQRIARSLRGFINNPDVYTFPGWGMLEDGHLPVVATATTGMRKATFQVRTGWDDEGVSTPIAFYLYLGGVGTTGIAGPNDVNYQGSSVYLVTITGAAVTGQRNEIRADKIYGFGFGNGRNANADVISAHFGTGDTGNDFVARSSTVGLPYDVTISFGTNINQGMARIEPAFKRTGRYLNPFLG